MNVITKLMYSIHRILGTLLCILFLMWFLSAFVMMYHRFPRVSAKEKMQKLEMLSQAGGLPPGLPPYHSRLSPSFADRVAQLPRTSLLHRKRQQKRILHRCHRQPAAEGEGQYEDAEKYSADVVPVIPPFSVGREFGVTVAVCLAPYIHSYPDAGNNHEAAQSCEPDDGFSPKGGVLPQPGEVHPVESASWCRALSSGG